MQPKCHKRCVVPTPTKLRFACVSLNLSPEGTPDELLESLQKELTELSKRKINYVILISKWKKWFRDSDIMAEAADLIEHRHCLIFSIMFAYYARHFNRVADVLLDLLTLQLRGTKGDVLKEQCSKILKWEMKINTKRPPWMFRLRVALSTTFSMTVLRMEYAFWVELSDHYVGMSYWVQTVTSLCATGVTTAALAVMASVFGAPSVVGVLSTGLTGVANFSSFYTKYTQTYANWWLLSFLGLRKTYLDFFEGVFLLFFLSWLCDYVFSILRPRPGVAQGGAQGVGVQPGAAGGGAQGVGVQPGAAQGGAQGGAPLQVARLGRGLRQHLILLCNKNSQSHSWFRRALLAPPLLLLLWGVWGILFVPSQQAQGSCPQKVLAEYPLYRRKCGQWMDREHPLIWLRVQSGNYTQEHIEQHYCFHLAIRVEKYTTLREDLGGGKYHVGIERLQNFINRKCGK